MKSLKFIIRTGAMILFILIACFQISVPAAKDTQPPTAPVGLTASNVGYTSIALSWSAATDDTGVKGYQLFRDGKKIVTVKKTSYTNSNLIPGRKYTYTVRAYDAAGNISRDSTTLSIAAKSDTQAPTTPVALTAVSKTYTTIELSWNPSTDNTGIKTYEIYCNNGKVGSTSATHYVCKSLLPGSTYTFHIKACDMGGNFSAQSSSISASTTADTYPPSVPLGLKTSSISYTEVTLTWSPSSDNVKVKKYEIFRDGVKVGTAAKTNYTSKSLSPGKSYIYSVRAVDSVGNTSGSCSDIKVTTQKDTEAPSIPSNLTIKSVSKSSVSLAWNASTDNVKVKGYEIYHNGLKIATTTKTSCKAKRQTGLGIDIYYVKAYDLVDNLSGSSNKVTAVSIY